MNKPSKRLKVARRKLDKGINALGIPQIQKLQLEAILGKKGHTELMNAADTLLGHVITRELPKAMIETRAAWPPDTKSYFITMVPDVGVVSDRTPTPDIDMLVRMALLALKLTKLHGVFKIEVHPLMNWPAGGEGRSLLWHIHIIGWTRS